MEEGSLRCDANVSIRPRGQAAFGTKAEVKNVNSFRYLEKALEFEIDRQIDVIESGGKVVQETRLWDTAYGSHALDAQQGRGARLPLLSRTGPAAAPRRRGAHRARPRHHARIAGRAQPSIRRRVRHPGVRRGRVDAIGGARGLFRSDGQGGRKLEGGEQLDHGRTAAHAQGARAVDRSHIVAARGSRRVARR